MSLQRWLLVKSALNFSLALVSTILNRMYSLRKKCFKLTSLKPLLSITMAQSPMIAFMKMCGAMVSMLIMQMVI